MGGAVAEVDDAAVDAVAEATGEAAVVEGMAVVVVAAAAPGLSQGFGGEAIVASRSERTKSRNREEAELVMQDLVEARWPWTGPLRHERFGYRVPRDDFGVARRGADAVG